MNKRWGALMLAMALLCGAGAARADAVIRVNGVSMKDAGGFAATYPDVAVDDGGYTHYSATEDLLDDMERGAFAYDAFVMDSACIDHRAVMRAGYCLDLSGSEALRSAVQRLHPAFAAQCVMDGRVCAIPHTFQMNYMTFSTAALDQAGMRDVAVPASFPEFLDFLEAWIAHKQANPSCEVAVLGMRYWDGDYSPHAYSRLLVELLLENYMMQQAYAGIPPRFDEAGLLSLLNRCRQIGQALHEYDHSMTCSTSVLGTGLPTAFPDDAEILSLRLDESQPHLIATYVSLYAVRADTQQPEVCIALMEQLCQNNWPMYNTLMYQGTGPLLDPQYPSEIARQQAMADQTQALLADDTLASEARAELEYRLARQQAILNDYLSNEDKQYLVTAADLAAFRAHADQLFIQTPGPFPLNALREVIIQFAANLISAEDLCRAMQ